MSIEYSTKIIEEGQESFIYSWLGKWSRRKEMVAVVANAYSKSDILVLKKKALKVRDCANFLWFEACVTGADGHTRRLKAGNFCDDRLCSVCNRKRAIKLISAFMLGLKPYQSQKYKLVFMTLTVRNMAKIDGVVYKRLMGCWRKFQRTFLLGRKYKNKGKENYYTGSCIGGVVAVETTFNEDQSEGLVWHPHLHGVLVCKEYLDQKAASEYWEKVTGDSFVVGFSKLKFDSECGVLNGVLETVKYLAKLNYDMPGDRIVELALALRRVRCINGFGVLKSFMTRAKELKKRQEQGLVCKKCGRDLVGLALKWYGDRYLLRVMSGKEEQLLKAACCNRGR